MSRDFAICVVAPKIDFSIDSLLAGMALGSGLSATENIVESGRDRFLDE